MEAVELPFEETLTPAGGVVNAVLFPESGMVSLLATLEGDGQVEVGIVGREGLIGLPLVLDDDHSLVEARVQQEGTALRLDAAALRDGMGESAAPRTVLLRYAMAFNTQVSLTAACNTFHVVEQRLARWLLTAHDRADSDEFPMTHDFLSAMLAVHRPPCRWRPGCCKRLG
ncbi:Crp/Fnr family transcriptional regulator [Belnapia sp. F-4-1]|uniref:Crp/Fnr family transcriptional regulator n=1 Tax=Belnapia sp. F-4-1 TaxID=1545443 RepID=UPI001F1BC091|nr:Crp/Fnr family transcriptional regulator [Belnapia sp. F-4-1]